VEGRLSSYTRETDGLKRTEVSVNAFRVQELTKSTAPYPENQAGETAEEEMTEEAVDMEAPPGDDEELPF